MMWNFSRLLRGSFGIYCCWGPVRNIYMTGIVRMVTRTLNPVPHKFLFRLNIDCELLGFVFELSEYPLDETFI